MHGIVLNMYVASCFSLCYYTNGLLMVLIWYQNNTINNTKSFHFKYVFKLALLIKYLKIWSFFKHTVYYLFSKRDIIFKSLQEIG